MSLIGSYIRSWERPGDLPRVIEILCLFHEWSAAKRAKRNKKFYHEWKITRAFPNNACKYLFLPYTNNFNYRELLETPAIDQLLICINYQINIIKLSVMKYTSHKIDFCDTD